MTRVDRNHSYISQLLSRRRETSPRRIVIRHRYLACVYFSWLSTFSSFIPNGVVPNDRRRGPMPVRPDYTDSDAPRMISENSCRMPFHVWLHAKIIIPRRDRETENVSRIIVHIINVGSPYLLEYPLKK